jgi:hypothetical protein
MHQLKIACLCFFKPTSRCVSQVLQSLPSSQASTALLDTRYSEQTLLLARISSTCMLPDPSLPKLNKPVLEQVPRIVTLFCQTRGLDKLVRESSSSGSSVAMDPVEMDSLLGELRSLLACCQEFVGFLNRTVAEAVQPAPVPRSVLEALWGGTYARAIHELQAAYVSLERVYLEESVTKAIGLDAVVTVRSFVGAVAKHA